MSSKFPAEFTLEELTRSNTAKRLGIDNTPTGKTLQNLEVTANKLVDVKAALGYFPVLVSSGYRSPELNKHIPGSSNTSAHTLGYAVDFTCPKYGTPLKIAARLATSDIMNEVDQLIYEYDSWVHISFDPRKRKQVLTIDKRGTQAGLFV